MRFLLSAAAPVVLCLYCTAHGAWAADREHAPSPRRPQAPAASDNQPSAEEPDTAEQDPPAGAQQQQENAPDRDPGELQSYTAGSQQNTTGSEEAQDSFSGYVLPSFSFFYRPTAVPSDRISYGADSSTLGLIFAGRHFKYWSYTAHLTFTPAALRVVTSVGGGGSSQSEPITGVGVQELGVTFQPSEYFALKAGDMFIPFSVEGRVANTALMFLNRATANEVFASGADRGILIISGTKDEMLQASLGAFNGKSLGFRPTDIRAQHGLAYSFRTDVNPFGAFPFVEGDPERKAFRLGLGIGAVYLPATYYDSSGLTSIDVRDLRISASLRLAFSGVFFTVEYLRRQQTDSISGRPKTATGAYTQASYYQPFGSTFAISPLSRLGLTVEDQSFNPRTTGYLELGVSFFPRADAADPNAVKLTLGYNAERRITEGENAYGASLSAQIKFLSHNRLIPILSL